MRPEGVCTLLHNISLLRNSVAQTHPNLLAMELAEVCGKKDSNPGALVHGPWHRYALYTFAPSMKETPHVYPS